jgi:two-component system, cell cycle response regulator
MLANAQPTFLLASNSPALIAAVEPALLASGATVQVELTVEAARMAMLRPVAPTLALLDADLPGMESSQLLATVRTEAKGRRFPIVLISDTFTAAWMDRLAEGVIDDLVPQTTPSPYLHFRIEVAIRAFRRSLELEQLQEAAAVNSQTDLLTGVYNRPTVLNILFRETDRVQRMSTPLSMILFDIDDFGHWNSRLGTMACDDILVQVVGRVQRLLRSYDLLGRVGKDEFLLGLPGCNSVNAVILAERVRTEVFSLPFHVAGRAVRLSACFGLSESQGRSPVVVLREAEQALQFARAAGPESIQCAGDYPQSETAPVAFLSPTSSDDLLAW